MLRVGSPIALASMASAWYGQRVRSRCIDARARHEAWVVDHLAQPEPLPSTSPASPPTLDAP